MACPFELICSKDLNGACQIPAAVVILWVSQVFYNCLLLYVFLFFFFACLSDYFKKATSGREYLYTFGHPDEPYNIRRNMWVRRHYTLQGGFVFTAEGGGDPLAIQVMEHPDWPRTPVSHSRAKHPRRSGTPRACSIRAVLGLSGQKLTLETGLS